MWELFAGVGAFLAGIFLLLKEGLPLARARASGVIHTRGARPAPIRRDEDPVRYASLWRQRARALAPLVLLILGGAAWTAMQVYVRFFIDY